MRVQQILLASALAFPLASTTAQRPTLAAAVDRYLAPLIALDVFNGVVLIARGDSILLHKGYGLADAELTVPMKPDAAFRIASISKSFTRALVGRLADKGLIQLDDTLSKWLPTFPQAQRITIQMLLDHRAGVPSMNSLPFDEEALAPNTLSQLVAAISKKPLDFEPGTRVRYSNGGYAVLAEVIEKVTGKSYGAALDEEVLRPSGLAHTRHQHDGEFIPGLAHGMMPSADMPGRMAAAPFQEMSTKAGGGSLVSTAQDLFRWARTIGKTPLLAPNTWRRLFPDDTSFSYTGRCPGYNAIVLREGEITVVVLANNYAAGAVSDVGSALAAIANRKAPDALPVKAPVAGMLSGADGSYVFPDGALPVPPGTAVEFRRIGDNLVAFLMGAPVDVLIPQGGRTFLLRSLWSLATFAEPVADGTPAVEIKPLYGRPAYTARRTGAATP